MLGSMLVFPALFSFGLSSAVPSFFAVYVTWTFLYVTVYGFAPLDRLEQSRLFIQLNATHETHISYLNYEKNKK